MSRQATEPLMMPEKSRLRLAKQEKPRQQKPNIRKHSALTMRSIRSLEEHCYSQKQGVAQVRSRAIHPCGIQGFLQQKDGEKRL